VVAVFREAAFAMRLHAAGVHAARESSSWASRIVDFFGGAKRDRTADLLVANEALSQLSYSPTMAGTTSISLKHFAD
jgi:hypothetical protein